MQNASDDLASGGAGPSPTGGLDRLSARDFARLSKFIQDYSGIKMPPGKMTMVEGRLRRRVRATRAANLNAYCRYLFDQDGLEKEAIHLIDAVTTNKTEFFREPQHFKYLAEQILPELTASRRGTTTTPLKMWSAACSIGAEPYTIAMVMADHARKQAGLRGTILATDLCTEVLRTAIQGIYPEQMMAPVPPASRKSYVMRSKDPGRGLARIVPELRQLVQFGRLNLMDRDYPFERDMDVIFCRNILIYFDKPTQEGVLRRLCDHLRPGGYLFLGHSETLAGFDLPLQVVGTTLFRRV
jgi:chemotaxis protein methyltransferase CheR